MPYPRPVPSLTEDEAAQFRAALHDFEAPDGMDAALARHRDALD